MSPIKGEKEDDLQNGLFHKSFFETVFNMTLDIDAKIIGSHTVTFPKNTLNFTISNRWDGLKEEKTGDVKLSMEQGANETVVVNILAPYFEVKIFELPTLRYILVKLRCIGSFFFRTQDLPVGPLDCPTFTSGTMRMWSFSFSTTGNNIWKCRSLIVWNSQKGLTKKVPNNTHKNTLWKA